jgi:hypothetical protein
MRIALFTPFSPEIGGGSVQLRSHLAQLSALNIDWYYLAPTAVQSPAYHCLGPPFSPLQFAFDLSARTGLLPGSTKLASHVADQMSADLYWVVGHYEGVSIAAELLSRGKPVHLTVHDEPLAMLTVSRRFRALWPLMSYTFSRVLRAAKSVDVTSTGMRDYFKRKYDVNAVALYKYVPQLPQINPKPSPATLTVGHIGKLYHSAPFRQFVQACRDYAASVTRGFKVIRIGSSAEMDKLASELPSIFEPHGELLEQDAFPVLARCDFVYAMYPPGFRFQGFRRTSLPIKLSTYIQAQRPIFAHTPPDSGLAQLVEKHRIGCVCTTSRPDDLRRRIEEILSTPIPRENFEAARQDLMGKEQIEQLKLALQH